jgi:hypothetical protein
MTTARSKLLRLFSQLNEEATELRFGQLVANLATLARGANVEAIWDAEDDPLRRPGPSRSHADSQRPRRLARRRSIDANHGSATA